MNLSDEVDLEDYVSRPDKISAADISAICQEAGMHAVRKNRWVTAVFAESSGNCPFQHVNRVHIAEAVRNTGCHLFIPPIQRLDPGQESEGRQASRQTAQGKKHQKEVSLHGIVMCAGQESCCRCVCGTGVVA